jgi:hypothetical protein
MVAYSSVTPATQSTVYPSSSNAVGFNYVYVSTSLSGYAGAASLLYFDVQTAIAGKTILEAKLVLREVSPPPLDLLGSFKLAAMATTWNPSTVTWTSWSTTSYYNDTWVPFGASSTTTVSTRVFDVLGIVQHWASGFRPNYGFTLFDDLFGTPGYQSAQQMQFESLEYYTNTANRPQLYIRYR